MPEPPVGSLAWALMVEERAERMAEQPWVKEIRAERRATRAPDLLGDFLRRRQEG